MSGRRRPSSPATVVCSSKSQCSSMPASSTTRRSCISPQRPRTAGALQRAHQAAGRVAQLLLRRRRSSSAAGAARRRRCRARSSIARICSSTFSSDARTGPTIPSIACCCAALPRLQLGRRSLCARRRAARWPASGSPPGSRAAPRRQRLERVAELRLRASISARCSSRLRASASARAASAARWLSASRSAASSPLARPPPGGPDRRASRRAPGRAGPGLGLAQRPLRPGLGPRAGQHPGQPRQRSAPDNGRSQPPSATDPWTRYYPPVQVRARNRTRPARGSGPVPGMEKNCL